MAVLVNSFLISIVIFGFLRLYLKIFSKRCKSRVVLSGKTALVTGANVGLGYETALDLASRGAKVILAVRNPLLGEEARRKIVKETKNPNVVVRLLDLASLDSVRAFAEDINNTEERLDILVNNAGVFGIGNERTNDGLHTLMQVNHFGPFLLTILLVNLLKKSAPSRIIFVSSVAAGTAKLDLTTLNDPGEGDFIHNFIDLDYANSKLCNILMSNVLAEKLRGTGVTSNSLHPGIIKTEISRRRPKIQTFFFNAFRRSVEIGAQTQIYCAVGPELEGVTGKYFDNCTMVPFYSTVSDDLAKKVWKRSEELVKLRQEEKLF